MNESAASAECPTCGRKIDWTDDWPCRPFCSERCQMVDLGAWFSEERAIPDDRSPSYNKPEDGKEH